MKKTVLSILITLLIGTALWRMPVFAEQISDEEFAVLEDEKTWEDAFKNETIDYSEEDTESINKILSDKETELEIELVLEEGYLETDTDELLYQYIDKALLGVESQSVKLRSANLGARLSDPNSIIYEALLQNAEDIVAGEQTSTFFFIDMSSSSLYGSDKRWYAEDLGIDSLGTVVNGNFIAADDFKEAFYNTIGYDMSKVVISLLRDHPYEMFWFGNKYTSMPFYSIHKEKETEGRLYATIPDVLLVHLSASWNYSVADNIDENKIYPRKNDEGKIISYYTYFNYIDQKGNSKTMRYDVVYHDQQNLYYDSGTIDCTKLDKVQTAITNAKKIVSDNSCTNDYDTLFYYFSTVSSLSEYNRSAVVSYPGKYGDPWQLIYLFDGDPATKVVCEGFSKGMQYLCDMTQFIDDSICCYCVTGDYYVDRSWQGFHMWNILHMDDGNNYLIDATNSKVSNPWGFLAPYMAGNAKSGYTIDDRYTYVYSEEQTWLVYTEEELTLFGSDIPTNLSASVSDGVVKLTWNCNGNPSGFRISKSEDGRDYYDVGKVWDGSILTWVDEDAENGTYYYRVSSYVECFGKERESEFSEPVISFVSESPKLLNLNNTKSSIQISWSATEGADGYKIYYSVNGSKFSWLKTVRSPSVLSWTGLGKVTESGDVIKIKIRAYRTVDGTVCYSPYSKTGTLIRLQRRTIANVYNTASCVALSWNRDKAADGYLVYRSVNGGEYKLVRTVTANKTVKWTDTAASKTGKRYTYKVLSYKKLDGVRYCSYPSAAVKTYRVPRPAVSSLKKTESGIRISWDKTETADGYYIYRSVNGGSFKKIKDVTSGKAGTYTDKKATKKDTKYTYHIVAYNTVSGKQYVSYRSKNKSMKIR